MKNNKGQLIPCVCLAMCFILTGCDSGSMFTAARDREKWAEEASEAAEVTAEAEESTLQYVTDDADAEDYRTLAGQYADMGAIRRQRDLLEQSYRLFGSEETLEELSAIWVNLEEEDTAVQEMGGLMLQNLELDEYRAECLHMVEEADWFETMMPKLQAGCRNYFQQVNNNVQLVVTVGYTDEETQFSRIWYLNADGSDYYLSYDGRTALLMEAEDDLTDGTFTLWTFDGLTGNIQREAGTLADGVLDLTSKYTIERFEGSGKGDIYDMMQQRESVEYTELDSYGGAPDKSKLSEVQAAPEFTVYEPVDTGEQTASDVQIRVCDGELQWLSEDGWIPLGTLDELAETDLFRAYAEEKAQYDEAIRQAQAEAEAEPETEETEETQESTEESQPATIHSTTRPTQSTTTTQTTTPSSETQTESVSEPSAEAVPSSEAAPSANTTTPSSEAATPSSEAAEPSSEAVTPSTQAAETTTPASTQTDNSSDNSNNDNNDDSNNNNDDSSNNDNNSGSNNDTGSAGSGTTDTSTTDTGSTGTTDTGTTDTGTSDTGTTDTGTTDTGTTDTGTTDTGTTDTGTTDTGTTDTGATDDGSNDTDVEWTEDLL